MSIAPNTHEGPLALPLLLHCIAKKDSLSSLCFLQARRLDRRQKLLFEAESSARRNAAIAMKWASLFEKEIPLDLLNDMESQREACLKVISQKDELIKVSLVWC